MSISLKLFSLCVVAQSFQIFHVHHSLCSYLNILLIFLWPVWDQGVSKNIFWVSAVYLHCNIPYFASILVVANLYVYVQCIMEDVSPKLYNNLRSWFSCFLFHLNLLAWSKFDIVDILNLWNNLAQRHIMRLIKDITCLSIHWRWLREKSYFMPSM